MGNRVLVTGGAGFIGSHIVRALLERGDTVRVLDNFATGRRDNLTEVADAIELIDGDLRDIEACRSACRNVETVLHLAALGSVPRSIADPLTTDAVNVQGTLHLLLAARDCDVKRVVFSSSSSVYGDTPVLPKHEKMCLNPRSPYAVSKLTGEEYCRVFQATYGIETVSLRYFNVFGPRQDPNSQYAAVIPRFISALMTGGTPIIYGDGLQSRDFTFVSNVVDANLLAAVAPGASGHVCNIACGEQITLLDLLEQIGRLMNRDVVVDHRPARAGDVKHSRADITAASDLLGYRPRVLFAEGLAATVSWYCQSQARR
jgi:nucleoside-diphosphate-sugar epimerase